MNLDNGNLLVQLTKCNINFFKANQKGIVSSGVCSVLKTGSAITFKSARITLLIPTKETIIRLTQVTYTTYLYLYVSGGVYTISCPNSDPLNQILYKALCQNIEVLDYFMLQPDLELKQKINEQVTLGQLGTPQLGATNDDKLHQIGQGIGNIFGGISSLIDSGKINRQSQQVITRFSKNTFGDETLSKWQRFKNKCAEYNDKVTQVFKPINSKCQQFASDIGNKFQASDNSIIKNVREYSKKTQIAINTGYEKGDASRRGSYVPPTSSNIKSQELKDNQPQTVNFGKDPKILQQQKINERKSLL